MKAVIVEKRMFMKAALTEEGEVIRTMAKGDVGDTIYIREKAGSAVPALRYVMAFSVILFMLAGGLGFYQLSAEEYSYVSLDINPSIEFVLNRFNKVVNISALNDIDSDIAAAELCDSNIKGKDFSEAIDITMNTLKKYGYLDDEQDDYIMVHISSDNSKKQDELEKETREAFKDGDHLLISSSGKQEREEAKQLGMSTGKYVEMMKNEDIKDNRPDKETVEHYNSMEIKDFFEKELEHKEENGLEQNKEDMPSHQQNDVPQDKPDEHGEADRPANAHEQPDSNGTEPSPEPEH